jgi:hypothetical protein
VHLEPLVTVLVTILVLPVTILSPGVILKLFAPLLEQVCRNGAGLASISHHFEQSDHHLTKMVQVWPYICTNFALA